MDYDGKFRDFMVGWLAQQLTQPEAQREDIETLYYAVVEASSDRKAVADIKQALDAETAQQLWGLSEQWHDPAVEQASALIEALRDRVQEQTRDHTQFYLFFLNPFKAGCVPDGFEDRLEQEICWMFRMFYHTVGEAVLAPKQWEPYVAVEPSYEDASNIIVLAHPQEDFKANVFLLKRWHKAWNLCFANLPALARELLALRHSIEQATPLALLGHYLTQMLTELIDQKEQELTARKGQGANDRQP